MENYFYGGGVKLFKKALAAYFVIVIVVFYLVIVALGITNDLETKRIEYQTIRLNRWNYELKEVDFNKVKFTYSLVIANYGSGNDFIRLVKPVYKKEIANIIEFDDYIVVNKEIKPKEEIEISWDIIVNTDGLKEVNLKDIKNYLSEVTISTANHNAYHTYYPSN